MFLRQFRAHLQSCKGTSKGNADKLIEALDQYEDALAPTLELIPYGGKILSLGMRLVLARSRKSRGSAKEIEEIFRRIATESAKLKRRTIVLMDDIDRLNATEIRQIFQLVKVTAPLPYVTYVVAFDRTAVASALKQDSGVESGEEYLDKIVQVAFELPAISETAFASLITEGIESLLANYPPAHFDTARVGSIFPSFRACSRQSVTSGDF
jgi:predicted KAP-like P-loop ATPase